jgi:sulfatase modifying factor 1
MENLVIPLTTEYALELVFIAGTAANDPFLFGDEWPIVIPDYYISKYQTTQAIWKFVMGDEQNHSHYKNDLNPVEHVSWDEIQDFTAKLNVQFSDRGIFRLPTETEWEYAARGGRHWRDGFRFAGTDNMKEAGWYEGNAGPYADLAMISQLKNHAKLTQPHPVGQKKPNQLGLYDMNGNLWEWCQDWYTPDARKIPRDGSAYNMQTDSKILRGGCHHNGAVHCTSTKRYEIIPDAKDACIGFRLALTLNRYHG